MAPSWRGRRSATDRRARAEPLDAPAFKATSIDVKVDSAVPGLDQIAKSFFQKNAEVPILPGAEQC